MATPKYPPVSKNSLRALAYEIKNEMSGGITTDDSLYSLRLIEANIKHHLGLAQKQEDEINEAQGILPNAQRITTFPCIPLLDSAKKCKCTETGGKLKFAKLPQLLNWRGTSFIDYIGNTDMTLAFTPVSSMTEMDAADQVIKRPTYLIGDNGIYVRLPKKYKLMCEITVRAIPDDPSAGNGLCFDIWSAEWNVPEYMKAVVKERVKQAIAPILMSSGQNRDMRNNSQDGNQFVTTQTP